MLNKLKELREDPEDGFTLIEILVVILIIGILASIAIPVFLNQRKVANDASVKSDVRNVATVIEDLIVATPDAKKAIFIAVGGSKLACVGPDTITNCTAPGGTATAIAPIGSRVNISEGVTVHVYGDPSASIGYTVNGWHSNGNKYNTQTNGLKYLSNNGGMQ